MIKKICSVIVIVFLIACSASKNNSRTQFYKKRILLTTDSGEIVLRLYNKTPLHRDNFLKLVKQHYFDSFLFHRVIKNFMIQGGDPNSKNALPNIKLGNGGPGYTIPAELDSTLFHKKGILAAARDVDTIRNPLKASSGSQFYIVHGKKFTDAGLDSTETFRLKGRKIPLSHREVYKTTGGAPHLDMGYTVFGEVESGLEVVDKIAGVLRDKSDRPFTDLHMKMRIKKK